MNAIGNSSVTGLVRADVSGTPGLAARVQADSVLVPAEEPFGHVARLAALVLGTRQACVTVKDQRLSAGNTGPESAGLAGRRSPAAPSLCQYVIDSAEELVIGDARLDSRAAGCCPAEAASVRSWAGFPVRGPDGHVVGALCVADHLPRQWSAGDLDALRTMALVAADEVALQFALQRGDESAALAQTLQESLLPARLPDIPGLQMAARYMAGGNGASVLGDFYDVFPSVRGSWGVVVGDVCGKGVPTARSTALARYTLRAEAHRETRPRLILAALNQMLLERPTDELRFLTAIYATVRLTLAGASVKLSSGGHPLALVRRAGGRVQTFGRPGTLLGVFPEPELHDSRGMLRPGDSLVMFTDGVTEARGKVSRDLYGDDRFRDLVASLHDLPATLMADAIRQAVRGFSGADISDDTVALVLKVPARECGGRP
jgi:serine phosphatase RsbU (regulator of sigma subunit)